MVERIGEWFLVEGVMTYKDVNYVLEFQKHGDKRKFGEIALSRHLITGTELNQWMDSQMRT